jgi:HEAT repeat protein
MADISEENFVVDFSPAFRLLLADRSHAVRLAALDGLWDSSNTNVVDPVIELMESDAEQVVRAAAAATLGHFVLMGEWGQIDQQVADRIVAALLQQFHKSETASAVRGAVLESLGNAAHPEVPELIGEAYRHGSEPMQLSAVFAMGRSADKRWMPILLEEMRSPVFEMRLEAARAAGNIGHSDAVPQLAELLYDEELEVQLAAVTALGQIGSEEAYELLLDLSEDPDAYRLHDAATEAMEEMEWLSGEIDLAIFDWDGDDDEETPYT